MDVMVYAALCQENQEHDAAYALLRYAVKQLFDLPELPEIVKEEKGKPYFPQYSRICFNLSHSYGAAVCAVHDRPIGVDVEKVRPAPRRLAKDMGDTDFFCRGRLWRPPASGMDRTGAAFLQDRSLTLCAVAAKICCPDGSLPSVPQRRRISAGNG